MNIEHLFISDYMVRYLTLLLDEEIYEMLIRESIIIYGVVKAISKALNEILRERIKDNKKLIDLINSEKLAKITQKEFENR